MRDFLLCLACVWTCVLTIIVVAAIITAPICTCDRASLADDIHRAQATAEAAIKRTLRSPACCHAPDQRCDGGFCCCKVDEIDRGHNCKCDKCRCGSLPPDKCCGEKNRAPNPAVLPSIECKCNPKAAGIDAPCECQGVDREKLCSCKPGEFIIAGPAAYSDPAEPLPGPEPEQIKTPPPSQPAAGNCPHRQPPNRRGRR